MVLAVVVVGGAVVFTGGAVVFTGGAVVVVGGQVQFSQIWLQVAQVSHSQSSQGLSHLSQLAPHTQPAIVPQLSQSPGAVVKFTVIV